MNAIPTMYGGVQFRSRLEARWAALFDLLEMKWQYEPIDLAGYIPDFLIGELLVEVKPVTTWPCPYDEWAAAAEKLKASGWAGDAVLVGAALPELALGAFMTRTDDRWRPVDFPNNQVRELVWREAGNRVQWKAHAPAPVIEITESLLTSVVWIFQHRFKNQPASVMDVFAVALGYSIVETKEQLHGLVDHLVSRGWMRKVGGKYALTDLVGARSML